jgi:hypothetical protein
MARVRIEWVRLGALDSGGGAAVNQPLALFGAAQVMTVGATPVSASAPTLSQREAGVEGAGYARITGLSGAVNVAWGDAPVASETAGWRVESGAMALVPIASGQAVSLIEAADPPAAIAAAPMKAIAVGRSGALAAAATAQDLTPANPDRAGWLIQNQSAANLYVRSKGAAGATLATMDGESLIVPPGGYYEPPKITPHALSIIGVVAAQTFFAEEW